MKKQAFGILAMFSLLLVMTVASVNAQSKRSSINIPFNFNVGHKTLPAGEYTVEPIRRDSQNVWLVENRSEHISTVFTTIPVRRTETQKKPEWSLTITMASTFLHKSGLLETTPDASYRYPGRNACWQKTEFSRRR